MASSYLFVSCASHLELLLKEELQSLGLIDIRLGHRGIHVPNTLENIFKVNYLSRLATRVLLPLIEFRCPDADTLYKETRKISWLDYLDETKTLSIDANIHHPQIRHSLYGAQLVKDAICDVIREKRNARPSVNTKAPDVQLNLFIHNQKATLSFDTSGAPLYKRGWREHSSEASLPETLAAAILIKARYQEKEILCDPFCGSGTFLIEAASMATHTPAGYFRSQWGFTHLPSFKLQEWIAFKEDCDARRIPCASQHIIGSDSDRSTFIVCRDHLHKTGFEKQVLLLNQPVGKLRVPQSPTLVISNPPFGKRMDAPPRLYEEFGQFLKNECPATPWAYLLTSSFHLAKATRCPILSEWDLQHGGLHIGLYQLQNSNIPKQI